MRLCVEAKGALRFEGGTHALYSSAFFFFFFFLPRALFAATSTFMGNEQFFPRAQICAHLGAQAV